MAALPIARFAGLTYGNHDIHPVPIPCLLYTSDAADE